MTKDCFSCHNLTSFSVDMICIFDACVKNTKRRPAVLRTLVAAAIVVLSPLQFCCTGPTCGYLHSLDNCSKKSQVHRAVPDEESPLRGKVEGSLVWAWAKPKPLLMFTESETLPFQQTRTEAAGVPTGETSLSLM